MVANGVSRGKVHDGMPVRDCTYQQDTDEDAEGDKMEEVDEGNGENAGEGNGQSTRRSDCLAGNAPEEAPAVRGGRRGMEREDRGGRHNARERQNLQKREWRGGGRVQRLSPPETESD